MTMCKRLHRERVSPAEIDGVEVEPRCGSRNRDRKAKQLVLLIRQGGRLTVIHGEEQVALAILRRTKVDAIVFEPANIEEENRVSAWGYAVANKCPDLLWGAMLLFARANDASADSPLTSCSVALLPGLTGAARERVWSKVQAAGIAA